MTVQGATAGAGLVLALVTWWIVPHAQDSKEEARKAVGLNRLVVMIGVDTGKFSCAGAGLIVGTNDAVTLIATAGHVLVRPSDGVAVSNVLVRFHNEPSRDYLGTQINLSSDVDDLTVIAVSGRPAGLKTDDFAQLGDPSLPNRIKRDIYVSAIGCGLGGTLWDTPAQPGLMKSVEPPEPGSALGRVKFVSSEVNRGFSGGPLLHVAGNSISIIGLVRQNAATKEASDIRQVLEQLRRWHVPVLLHPLGTMAGCSYRVSDVLYGTQHLTLRPGLDLFPIGERVGDKLDITVATDPECGWVYRSNRPEWFGPDMTPMKGTGVARITARVSCVNSGERVATALVAGMFIGVNQADCVGSPKAPLDDKPPIGADGLVSGRITPEAWHFDESLQPHWLNAALGVGRRRTQQPDLQSNRSW